jgi:diguanylate cyclase (GGDEF)-like protein
VAVQDEALRAWAAACETPAFGSCAVTFDDPAAVVRAVLELTRAPVDPAAVDSLEQTVLHFRIHPSVAVVQLVALNRELHRLLDNRAADGEPVPNTTVDRAVNVAIAAVLDDLEQRGLVDPLTQLLNRRALDRDLVDLIRTSARSDRCLVVVMADLEGLKATNDTLGHSAGDERLRQAADTLASTLRTGDNVYRIGGDEFVLVMPDLALRDLEAVLGRVDDATATALTWGCAWARIMPDVDAEPEAARLLELADQRLLRYRWSEATVAIARDDHGEIVAGRFGPPSDQPRRRR